MICPSCGKELTENSLFCQYCGHEWNIVPDFEAEVEHDIEQNLKPLQEIFKKPQPEKQGMTKRYAMLAAGIVTGILLVAGLLWLATRPSSGKEKTAQEYVELARQEMADGKIEEAQADFLRAIEADDERVDAKLELVELYFQQNQKKEYEALLYDLIGSTALAESDRISCYGKLIAIYKADDNLAGIYELLSNCPSEEVRLAYEEYFASEPEFDMAGGYYTKVIAVKLSNENRKGAIYYTTDGSQPDETSTKYVMPIILEEGDHVIKAVYISTADIKSSVVTEEYHIELRGLEPPVISTVSGTYYVPTKIIVEQDGEEVYYTTDNTVPDKTSSRYTEPIDMPIGKSMFRFVAIRGDVVSEFVERMYELELDVNYTEEMARPMLMEEMIRQGKILNYYGDAPEAEYRYEYTYLTYCYIREKMYYVYAESRVMDEIRENGTAFYGVDAMDGTVERLQTENQVSFTLAEIKEP